MFTHWYLDSIPKGANGSIVLFLEHIVAHVMSSKSLLLRSAHVDPGLGQRLPFYSTLLFLFSSFYMKNLSFSFSNILYAHFREWRKY